MQPTNTTRRTSRPMAPSVHRPGGLGTFSRRGRRVGFGYLEHALAEGGDEYLLEVLTAVEELRGAARGAAPVGGRRRVHGERLRVEDDAVVFLSAAQADEAV